MDIRQDFLDISYQVRPLELLLFVCAQGYIFLYKSILPLITYLGWIQDFKSSRIRFISSNVQVLSPSGGPVLLDFNPREGKGTFTAREYGMHEVLVMNQGEAVKGAPGYIRYAKLSYFTYSFSIYSNTGNRLKIIFFLPTRLKATWLNIHLLFYH